MSEEKDRYDKSLGLTIVIGHLQIAFIVLKLCGVIAWPWLWVLSPLVVIGMLFALVFLFLSTVGPATGSKNDLLLLDTLATEETWWTAEDVTYRMRQKGCLLSQSQIERRLIFMVDVGNVWEKRVRDAGGEMRDVFKSARFPPDSNVKPSPPPPRPPKPHPSGSRLKELSKWVDEAAESD